MKISNINIEEKNGKKTLSALCGDFYLWYTFPAPLIPVLKADAFIAACLVPAMAKGSDIIIDDDIPISSVLLSNLEQLQTIFSFWSKYFHKDLKEINIIGGKKIDSTEGWDKTISFFSGGVDGTYTYLKHAQEIDYLLFAKGIDMQLSSDDLYKVAFAKNKNYLDSNGHHLIPFETNVRFLGHHYGLNWSNCFGGGLSSIALALGAKKCYIASGLTYENLLPESSNFITDHLWGNGFTEFVHDGAESLRINKLKYIANNSSALSILRVCWHDKGYNCGQCEKCLRTMASIRALKLDVPTFPPLTNQLIKQRLSKLKIYNVLDIDFIEENIAQAERVKDKVLLKALKSIKRSYELRKLFRDIDKLLFFNLITKLKKHRTRN